MLYFLIALCFVVVLAIKVNACRDLIFDMYTLLSKRMAHLESVVQAQNSQAETVIRDTIVHDGVVHDAVVYADKETAKPVKTEAKQVLQPTEELSRNDSDAIVSSDAPSAPIGAPSAPIVLSELNAPVAAVLPPDFVPNFIQEVEKKKKKPAKKNELK